MIKFKALIGLAKIGTEEAKSIIREALNDKNPSVRLKAAHIVTDLGEGSLVIPVLEELIKDPNVDNVKSGTRSSAIFCLQKIGNERAISIIRDAALNDKDKEIQKRAKEALERINKR